MKLTERIKNKVINAVKNPITYLTLIGTLNGCGEMKEPNREDFSSWISSFPYQLRDENGDGRADFIALQDQLSTPFYVDTLQSKDHVSEVGFSANQMSPEIVEAANNATRVINDLEYLFAKDRWEMYQERRQNDTKR